MATNSSDPNASSPGGLQSMLARLRGMVQGAQGSAPMGDEQSPNWNAAAQEAPVAVASAPSSSGVQLCPLCQAERRGTSSYCLDCGYIFPKDALLAASTPASRIKGRYALGEQLTERCGITRFRGLDHGSSGSGAGKPVI